MEARMDRRLPCHYERFTEAGLTQGYGFEPITRYLVDIRTMIKRGVGLCVIGSNGVGKSGALAVAFRRAKGVCPAWGSRDVMWCYAQSIATLYGYGLTDSQFEEPIDDLYNSAKFLVVDELGREGGVKNFESRQFNLLARRRDNNGVTCYATNLSLDKILNVYGEGFHSLLHEKCVIVNVAGPDRRRD